MSWSQRPPLRDQWQIRGQKMIKRGPHDVFFFHFSKRACLSDLAGGSLARRVHRLLRGAAPENNNNNNTIGGSGGVCVLSP